ncbi:uncharacterized protein LOC127282315 [Leptopilina boulardi]|uniref:uncharacterized protein LOC127282315 n=1 Tax=Leptopilina boulardi TaxID=63433 RepID=UPI0021F5E00E|nr:uncharacterized protein LOC127282315 [Leptopilina boulardi]
MEGKRVQDVKLSFNIDGLPISKSGTDSFWLILCSEVNSNSVYPVGAFCGKSKPDDANEFMKEFVDELISLCQNGLPDLNVTVSCENIICDAPAKSFAFYLKGHTGYNSFSKCEIGGIYISRNVGKKKKKGTVCFPVPKRLKLKTDDGFNRNYYNDIENGKETILKLIPNFGCISGVPLDYMHLVLLGVVKKIIQLWVKGPYRIKLRRHEINKISKKLNALRYSAPCEFVRRPRSLWNYTHWKATEFRTFLLYAAPIVLKGIRQDIYDHFMILHTAISVLVSDIHLEIPRNIDVCHDLLVRFVEDFETIYGKKYASHNIHNLLHLCNDVKRFGRLNKFSSFKYENYLSSIKRWIRKGFHPLEQIVRRYSERESYLKDTKMKQTLTLNHPHNSGPLDGDCAMIQKQYKILEKETFKLNCNEPKNSCVLLKNGVFGQVLNIIDCNNEIRLIIKKINCISQLYDNPDSRCINIYKGILSEEAEFSVPLTNVLSKVWRIPSSKGMSLLPLQHNV